MSQAQRALNMFHSLTGLPPGEVELKGILKGTHNSSIPVMTMNHFAMPHFQVAGRQLSSEDQEHQEALKVLESQLTKLQQANKNLQQEIETVQKKAYEKGHDEGFVAGVAEAQEKASTSFQKDLQQIKQHVTQTLESMNQAYGQKCQQIQDECMELALGIAKKLFVAETKHQKELITHIIQAAMEHLGQEESIILHIHPGDVPQVESREELWAPLGGNHHITIKPDERMEPGGCWIENEEGSSIDMRTSTLLARIEEQVRAHYRTDQP